MTIRYALTTPGPHGQSAGVEIDDDVTATGWQTDGGTVGRFRLSLDAADRDGLTRALEAARHIEPDPPAGGPRRPGAGSERIIADGVDLTVTDEVDPAAADLVERIRDLADRLTAHPVAAVVLEVTGPPWTATLRHAGDADLTVRTAALTVSVTVFGADSEILDSTEHSVEPRVERTGADERVGPGWTLDLVENLSAPTVPAGGFVTVTVTGAQADVRGDGILRGVEWGWVRE